MVPSVVGERRNEAEFPGSGWEGMPSHKRVVSCIGGLFSARAGGWGVILRHCWSLCPMAERPLTRLGGDRASASLGRQLGYKG